MNLIHLYLFLTEHPDWSHCLRLTGTSDPLSWGVDTAGIVAPSGQVYRLEAVAKALEMKKRG